MAVHIITDSASDARPTKQGDLSVVPMIVSFGEEQFEDGVTLSHDDFYKRLAESKELPVTSQVTPFRFYQAIEPHRSAKEEVIVITMSGKLSGTYQNAVTAAAGDPKVFVVDSENVTIGERVLVNYALYLAREGKEGAAIVRELEDVKKRTHLVATLDTLEYLRKGGRISKTAAFAGGLLNIKPVVETRDGEVVVTAKARGNKQGNQIMMEKIKALGVDHTKPFLLGYTGLEDTLLRKFMADASDIWAIRPKEPPITSVGATIGTHNGPGAIAAAWVSPK